MRRMEVEYRQEWESEEVAELQLCHGREDDVDNIISGNIKETLTLAPFAEDFSSIPSVFI